MKQILLLFALLGLLVSGCQMQPKPIPKKPASLGIPTSSVFSVQSLKQEFGTCELLHLTDKGHLGVLPLEMQVQNWNKDRLLQLIAISEKSQQIPHHATIGEIKQNATSFQAAKVYKRILTLMKNYNVRSINRQALADRAFQAHKESYQENFEHTERGYNLHPFVTDAYFQAPNCVSMQWLNTEPDRFLLPISPIAKSKILNLFSPRSPARRFDFDNFSFTANEMRTFNINGDTDKDAIHELRSVRIALAFLDRQFAMLYNDLGGFAGNRYQRGKSLVSLDETVIYHDFIQQFLQDNGVIEHFELDAGDRLVYRPIKQQGARVFASINKKPGKKKAADFVGLNIVHKATGKRLVVDSWVERGGMPPHVTELNDWVFSDTTENVVSVGRHNFDSLLNRSPSSNGQTLTPQGRHPLAINSSVMGYLEAMVSSETQVPAHPFDPTRFGVFHPKPGVTNFDWAQVPNY